MAGRKPKPTAVKKLEGNPGKRKLNTKEPVPAKGIVAAIMALDRCIRQEGQSGSVYDERGLLVF